MAITLVPPTIATFTTALNTPTATDGTYSMLFAPAVDAHIIRGYHKALPGGDFTVTVKVQGSMAIQYNGMGIIFKDSANKYVAGVLQHGDTAVGCRLAVGNWSDHTTQAADHALVSLALSEWPTWIRAQFTASSSDIQFQYSYTGDNWVNIGTSNTYLGTADAFGIGVTCWSATTAPRAWFEHYAVV